MARNSSRELGHGPNVDGYFVFSPALTYEVRPCSASCQASMPPSRCLEAYLAERPLEEVRLRRLAEHAEAGRMDEAQLERYRRLVELSEERRPLLERLGSP